MNKFFELIALGAALLPFATAAFADEPSKRPVADFETLLLTNLPNVPWRILKRQWEISKSNFIQTLHPIP